MSKQPDVRHTARYPADVHAWVSAEAERNGRSYNNQVVYLLRRMMTAGQPTSDTGYQSCADAAYNG